MSAENTMRRWARGAAAVLVWLAPVMGCREEYPDLPTEPPPGAETPPAKPVDLPTPAPAEPPCEPPHGGSLLAMSDGRGYVEWDVDAGRLYYLDDACKPLKGVQQPVLYVKTPAGPRQVQLADAGDEAYPAACAAFPADAAWLHDAETTGVLRFLLNGEGCRVLLKCNASDIQPAELVEPPPGAPSGS